MDLFLAIAFGACLVVEIILSGTWDGFYFRYGLPLFRRSLGPLAVGRISSRWLNELYARSWRAPLRFHRLTGSELAIREPLVAFKLFGMMSVVHGLIRGDLISGEAVLVLRANWWPVVVLVSLFVLGVQDAVVGTGDDPWFLIALGMFLLFAFSLAVELLHYRRLVGLIVDRFGGDTEAWWGEEEGSDSDGGQ